MKVLRASHEFLLTIVEVFIHDPLFKWALSPLRALEIQRNEQEFGEAAEIEVRLSTMPHTTHNARHSLSLSKVENSGGSGAGPAGGQGGGAAGSPSGGPVGNKEAERALLRLKAKLLGYEYGEALSVEGQVKQLIAEAQDPNRLCAMFHGWAAWV